ncbi:MAG: hypothetical protein ABFD97_05665 [Syntrophobacter sp.]
MDTILIRNVEAALRATKGILDIGWIAKEDIAAVTRSEQELQERGLGGLGSYCNEGVSKVISRQFVCAVLNNNEFRHADKPCLSWMVDDVVIGEEITDEEHLNFLKKQGKVKVIGKNFVVYFDRVKTVAGKPPVFVCRALAFPEIEGVPGVRDVLSASPIGSADMHLKRKFGWDSKDPELGTILIGFNHQESDPNA